MYLSSDWLGAISRFYRPMQSRKIAVGRDLILAGNKVASESFFFGLVDLCKEVPIPKWQSVLLI